MVREIMGTLTLEELKTGVRKHFGDRDDFDDRLTQLMNIAQVRLARDHDFEELKDRDTLAPAWTGTLTTDKFLTIAATIKEIYAIGIIDNDQGYPLIQHIGRSWEKAIPNPEQWTTGRPTIYRRWGLSSVELWRIPDQAYTYPILYANWPTDLASASGVSDLNKKDDLLIWLVCTWLAVEIDRPDRANYLFAIFRSEYDRAVLEDERKPDLEIAGYRTGAGGDVEYWKSPFHFGQYSESS